VRGIPPGDTGSDHLEASPRPPGNYAGLEYVRTFTESSWANRVLLPDWLSLSAMNLHPRLVFDISEPDGGTQRLKFAPQDFWVRFNLAGVDRLNLELGQFVLPYGSNPVLAPRQKFILPIEALDLGLKWDWGLALKGPLRAYDWQVAATIGSGEGLHSPHLFDDGRPASFLISGRVGAPTYWDLQYGLSFLYGNLAGIRGARLAQPAPQRRWRVALDATYKSGTYLMAGAQVSFGRDRPLSPDPARDPDPDPDPLPDPARRPASDVLGGRVWLDWVAPFWQDLRLGAQFESVVRDLSRTGAADTGVILEAGYSVSTPISLLLDYRIELERARGRPRDGLFLTLVYYAS